MAQTNSDSRRTAESPRQIARIISDSGAADPLRVTLDDGREFTGRVARGLFLRTVTVETGRNERLHVRVQGGNRRAVAEGDALDGQHDVKALAEADNDAVGLHGETIAETGTEVSNDGRQ